MAGRTRLWPSGAHPGSGYLQFNKPSGLAVDSLGNVYVTDYYSNHVEKIVPGRKR